jgi:hypothetical protein
MIFFLAVKKPITSLLFVAETIANISKGKLMPIPKTIKFNKLTTNSITDVLTANKTASEAGLQGKTIAPKNKPKIKLLM